MKEWKGKSVLGLAWGGVMGIRGIQTATDCGAIQGLERWDVHSNSGKFQYSIEMRSLHAKVERYIKS